jgi:hypothetical protein
VLLKWSAVASVRGWYDLSAFLLELHLALRGLGGASRRIRAEQNRRRNQPPRFSSLEYGEGR